MSTDAYNAWMLGITAGYLVITFLLFMAVAYETWYRPRAPQLRLYPHRAWWDWKMVDFVVENQGPTLTNLRISTVPEDLSWGEGFPEMLSPGRLISNPELPPISSIGSGEIHRHFWRSISKDLTELDDLFAEHHQVTLVVEFDNPQRALGFIGRSRRTIHVTFNKPAIAAYLTGIRTPLDMHQIARELDRIQTDVSKIQAKLGGDTKC